MGQAVGLAPSEEARAHFHSHAVSKPLNNTYPPELDWINGDMITFYTELGHPANIAQVHPELFTKRIADLAQEQGAQFLSGSMTKVNYTRGGERATSLTYTETLTSQRKDIEASE